MKVAIVSGASGNLGKEVVSYFLEQSYRVIGLVHRKNVVEETGQAYREIEVDLTDEVATEACVQSIIEKYTTIDVVVLTAGGYDSGSMEKVRLKDIEHQYRLNFLTAFNFARPALIHMKSQKHGTLFFIGSQPGMDTSKGTNSVAYSLSKSQLFQLANIFNSDTKDLDITTFVVVPSTIDTQQNREAMPNADYSKWEKPEAIARIIGRYATMSKSKIDQTFLVVQDEL